MCVIEEEMAVPAGISSFDVILPKATSGPVYNNDISINIGYIYIYDMCIYIYIYVYICIHYIYIYIYIYICITIIFHL